MGDAEADDLVPLWSDQPSSSQDPTSVAMSRDGSVIAMTSGNEKVYVYERNSSTPEWYYDANKDILSSAVSGDGKYLVIGLGWMTGDTNFGKTILFDTSSNTPLWSYTTSGHIYKVDISYNGSYIVSGGKEGKVRLHHKDSSTPLETKTAADINDVAISDNGTYYAAGSDDDKVRVYVRGSSSSWSQTLGGDVTRIAMTPDGEYLAVSVADGKVHLYETNSLSEKWSFDTGEEAWAIDISDDGLIVAAGNHDSEIYLLNSTGSQVWKYSGSDNFDQVYLSGNAKYLLAGQADGEMLLFEATNSTPYGEYDIGSFLTASEYVPTQLSISNGGEWLCGVSTDKYLRFFRNPDNFVPTFTSQGPANNTRVVTAITTVSWNATDYETNDTDLKYSVFFGTDKNNLSSVSDNQTASSWTTTTLTRGTTYWWQVRAYDGDAYRYSDKQSFTRNSIPVVNITSPSNWSHIPDTEDGTVTLLWESFDAEGDSLTFKVYLGESEDDLSLVGTTTGTNWEEEDLDTNVTYYWKMAVDDSYEFSQSTDNRFNLFKTD